MGVSRVWLVRVFVLASVVAFSSSAKSQQGSTKDSAAPSLEKVRLAIADLGSSDFGVRNAAASELRAMGFAVQEALGQAATEHPDAETRARAREIYEDLLHGIAPDTPASLVNAIQAIRTGKKPEQASGLRFLVSNEKFELILSAIRLRNDTRSRAELTRQVLGIPDAQAHFLKAENLQSLFTSLAANGPPLSQSDRVAVFSDDVISSIAVARNLELLLIFVSTTVEPGRFELLSRVIGNSAAFDHLVTSENAKELLSAIDLASTAKAKEELVSNLLANTEKISKIFQAGAMGRLLDSLDNDKHLTELFRNPNTLTMLVRFSTPKQIIELLNRVESTEERNSFARLIYLEAAKVAGEAPEKYSGLIDYFATLNDPWFIHRRTVDELRRASIARPANRDEIQRAFDALVAANVRLSPAELTDLLRYSVIVEVVVTEKGMPWLLTELEQLDIEDRLVTLEKIVRYPSFVAEISAKDGAHFFGFLDALLAVEDSRFRSIAILLVNGVRIDGRRPPIWLYGGLLKRSTLPNRPYLRSSVMLCIVSHEAMPNHIANSREYAAFIKQVESLESDDERTQIWKLLLKRSAFSRNLMDEGRLDVFLRYADTSGTIKSRLDLIYRVMSSSNAATRLIERGEFDVLDKALHELAAADPTLDALSLLYSNGQLITHCLQLKRGNEIRDYLNNVPVNRLFKELSPYSSLRLTPSQYDEIGETIWKRSNEIPKGRNPEHAIFHFNLLENKYFIKWMIERDRATDILDRIVTDFDAKELELVCRSFLDQKTAEPWLEAVTLDKYIASVESHISELDAGSLNLLLGSHALHKHVVSTKQGRKLFDLLRRLDATVDQNNFSKLNVLTSGQVLETLISSELGFELFTYYAQTEPGVRAQRLLTLAKKHAFSIAYLQEYSAKQLLDACWSGNNRDQACEAASFVVSHPEWRRDLDQRGDLTAVGSMLLAEPCSKSRDQALANMITSMVNPSDLADDEVEVYYRALYNSEETSREGIAAVLKSRSSIARLIHLGHFDELKLTAHKCAATSFFRHPLVLARLNKDELAPVVEQYWTLLRQQHRQTPFPQNDELFGMVIREHGVKAILEMAKFKQPDATFTLWHDNTILAAVIARGELVELWNGTPEKTRGRALFNVWQNERRFVDALKSTHAVTKFADWLDVLNDGEFIGFPVHYEAVATRFYRAGLGARYSALTERLIDIRKEKFGSTAPLAILERGLAPSDCISLQIERGEVPQIAESLRESIRTPRDALKYVSFLVANELADAQWTLMQSRSLDLLDVHEQYVIILLASALGKNDVAIELARKFKLDLWIGLLAVEQHDWKLAASSRLPLSSSFIASAVSTESDLVEGLGHVANSASPELDELEKLIMTGVVAGFAGNKSAHSEAVSAIKRIVASNRGRFEIEQYVVDGLILLGQGNDACDNFGFHPWLRFALCRDRGFYDQAYAACGWNRRPASEFFDAATRSADISDSFRLRGMSFLLEIAETERLLGQYDRARGIDDALSNDPQERLSKFDPTPVPDFPEPPGRDALVAYVRSYKARLFAEWMHRGNLEACEQAYSSQQHFDEHAIRHALFGSAGVRPGQGLLFDDVLTRSDFKMPFVERMHRVYEILDSPVNSEPTRSFSLLASRYLSDLAISGNTQPTLVFDAVTQHWGRRGEAFPLKDSISKVWIDNTNDMESIRWYAVARLRNGQFSEAARVLEEACQYDSTRADLLYLRGEALVRSATDDVQRNHGEEIRKLAIRQLDNGTQVLQLAESLHVAGELDAAISLWRLVRKITFPTSKSYTQATNMLSQFTPSVEEASNLKRESLVWLAVQGSSRVDATQLMEQVEAESYAAMAACLEKSDLDSLIDHWERLQITNPNQSVGMKRLIPQVDKAGHKEVADRLFQDTLQVMTSHVDQFKESIDFRIRRAEFCIANGRELNLARKDLDDAKTIAGTELDSIRKLRAKLEN